MKNLKSVYLDFDMKPFARMMEKLSSKNTPIEKLELACGLLNDDAIKYICEMKTITEIHFFQCIGFDENILTRLVQKLPNLKAISDRSDTLFNLDKILPILKNKRIAWFNEISGDAFVSYVSSTFSTFEMVFHI